MATKEGDALTQIQKYKAMLNSKRSKDGEKPIRKPKKKRLRKADVEKGLETVFGVPGLAVEGDLSKSQSENLREENFDSINIEATTVLSQESKQNSELPEPKDGKGSGEFLEQKSEITSPEVQNKPNEKEITDKSSADSPAKDEKESKKDKSKVLSIRRKRKSKKKRKETEDQPQSDKNKDELEQIHEEKYAWKESGSEQDEGSAVPFSSPETNQDENQTREGNVEENKSKEGAEGNEKVSRAKKFKRWASFTKHKKPTEPVVIEEESFNFDISAESTKPSNQITDPPEERATDVQIHDDSLLPGRKEEQMDKSRKEEIVQQPEDLVTLSSDKVQNTRTESSGKGNILESLTTSLRREKARTTSNGIKDSGIFNGAQDKENKGEMACSQKNETIPAIAFGTKNNESANEAENEQELKEKTTISIVQEKNQSFVTPTDDVNTELEEIETVKEKQPKKKKKGFLRKISSKSLKIKKGEETKTLKKSDISAPLLVTAKDETGSEEPCSNPEEVSPEKSSKRKKSGLNLKLPKGLIRASSSEYVAIAGAEVEQEIEKDETLTMKENAQQMEEADITEREEVFQSIGKVESSDENEGIETNMEELDYYRENNTEDEDVYTLCRVLMNDVIEELIEHSAKVDQVAAEDINPIEIKNNDQTKEEKMVTEDTQSSVVEKVKALEEDTSVPAGEEGERSFISETEEGEQEKFEKTKENSEQKKNGENVVSTELKEPKEIEVNECIQENSEVEPEQPEEISAKPDHEPQKTEDIPKPENIQTPGKDEPSQRNNMPINVEDESKEPKDMPIRHKDDPEKADNTLQSEQHNQVSQENEEKLKPSGMLSRESENEILAPDGKAAESESTSKLYDSHEDRSIEISLKTQALIDSYIFIDHSFELSQNFLNQVKIMDFSTKRTPRCSIM